MVAPLIVAARVVGGRKIATQAAAPKPSKRLRRGESSTSKTRDRIGSIEHQKSYHYYPNALKNKTSGLKNIVPENIQSKSLGRINALSTSISIFTTAIGFWIPQIIFWIVGIFGLGTESIPLLNYIIPGELIYMMSYYVIVLLGLCTLVYAVIIYYLKGVKFFSGYKGIILIFCITGYLLIFINFFPWFVVWLAAVAYLQDD